MTDKGHCMMNDDDEDEYQPFYDYARQYEIMGLPMEKPLKSIEEEKKPKKSDDNEGDDRSWEDCDLTDQDDEDEDEDGKEKEEAKLDMVVEEAAESSQSSVPESKATDDSKTES